MDTGMDAGIRCALRRALHRRVGAPLVVALALGSCLASAQQAPLVVPEVPPPVVDPAGAESATRPAADEAGSTEAEASGDAAFQAFVDGLVSATLERDDIAGMVVSVVADDRVLLAKGYGLARVDPPWPADAHESLFRIGSVSKTFTYTAAMQLIEQGRIGLEDPVERHLPPPLHLPAQGFEEPVRVRHLMTHTAGFEDTALGHLFERDPAEVAPLDEYLQRWRPNRVRAPDTHAVYSNYGVALLGALVAHVSGMPFEEYVERHVTGPLGMAHTTFREPLAAGDPRRMDPRLEAVLATGYQRRQGGFEPGAFEHVAHAAPAGSASASAADMARWMRVHLAEGELDGTRILSEDSARAMRGVLFANAEDASGIAHGFMTELVDGEFAYGHGGATLHFHTTLLLVPEHELGVFVSANTAHARAAVRDVARLVLRQLLPAPAADASEEAIALSPAELARYAGTYASNRRPYRSVEKLLLGVGGIARVAPAADGTLRVTQGGETLRYVPVARDRFRAADSGQRLVFLSDAQGRVTGYVADPGIAVMERVERFGTPGHLALLLTLAVGVAIARLVGSLRRRRHGHGLGSAPVHPRPGLLAVKMLALLDALAWIGFAVAAIVAVVGMVAAGNEVLFTYPSDALVVALALATVAAGLAALEVLALVPVWLGRWRLWPKLRYTLGVIVLALAVAGMWHWNLIGMRV